LPEIVNDISGTERAQLDGDGGKGNLWTCGRTSRRKVLCRSAGQHQALAWPELIIDLRDCPAPDTFWKFIEPIQDRHDEPRLQQRRNARAAPTGGGERGG
jgi:hypothetical protein